MIGNFAWLAIVSGACAVNMVALIVWFRAFRASGLYRAMLAGFVLGTATLIISSIPFIDRSIFWHALNLTIYLSFSGTYFHWCNMGETARRIRLITELGASQDGMTRIELLARYSGKEIVDRRLERMVESQQLRQIGQRYQMDNGSFLVMARVVALFKLLLDIKVPT
jgi:hypothetical protein